MNTIMIPTALLSLYTHIVVWNYLYVQYTVALFVVDVQKGIKRITWSLCEENP